MDADHQGGRARTLQYSTLSNCKICRNSCGNETYTIVKESEINIIIIIIISPEVRKMLVAGMVKSGKARVVKKTKKDTKSKDKEKK